MACACVVWRRPNQIMMRDAQGRERRSRPSPRVREQSPSGEGGTDSDLSIARVRLAHRHREPSELPFHELCLYMQTRARAPRLRAVFIRGDSNYVQ